MFFNYIACNFRYLCKRSTKQLLLKNFEPVPFLFFSYVQIFTLISSRPEAGRKVLAVTSLVIYLFLIIVLRYLNQLQPLGYQTLEKLHSAKATHCGTKCHRKRTSRRRRKSPHRLQTQPLGRSQHNQSTQRPHGKPASKNNCLNLQILGFLSLLLLYDLYHLHLHHLPNMFHQLTSGKNIHLKDILLILFHYLLFLLDLMGHKILHLYYLCYKKFELPSKFQYFRHLNELIKIITIRFIYYISSS